MPLSQNTKTESKSIEDLIAQLDAPPAVASGAGVASAGVSNNAANVESIDGSGQNADRKIIRGKRTNSTSESKGNGSSGSSGAGPAATAYYDPVLQKNIMISKKYSKALRSNKGRGLPKKGGSGGKGTWGAPGCELNYAAVDQNDPNYDSEDAGNVVMVCVENEAASRTDSDGGHGVGNTVGLQHLEIEDFDREIKPVILEYFQNGDTVEVIDQLKCYNFTKIKPQLISYIIQIALEQNGTCKELTSRLLRDFHFELFAIDDFEKAFSNLVKNINDLELDNPDASKTIATFIARCIADKCITAEYLKSFSGDNDDPVDSKVYNIIDEAKILTNMNDHLFHLSHIWGHNQGGFTAVKDLTDKVNVLIQEYYDSGDKDEAIRCLKELNVPHFNHEFVFEALDFVVQKGEDHAIDLITELFKSLSDSVVLTHDQLKTGFVRIYDLLPDLILDVPNAYGIIEKVIDVCQAKGIIGNDIVELAPNRARKRFVSEGDGGRVKEENGH